jgi:hypothetical protein
MKTSEQETAYKNQKLLQKLLESKDESTRKMLKYKYQADGLKDCKDNAMLMGEKKVEI